jgi:hypothetical protein
MIPATATLRDRIRRTTERALDTIDLASAVPPLFALLCLAPSVAATPQGPASNPGAIFVPTDRVPLSEFVDKTSTLVTVHVDPEILAWVSAHGSSVRVALQTSSNQQFSFVATSVNPVTGEVTLSNTTLGKCTAVCTLLRQDPSVVTHWNQSLNSGRGGQQIGARDGLSVLDMDVVTGAYTGSGGILNTDPNWFDPAHPEAGKYYFASNLYALFSDGTGIQDNAAVPSFERYIGETFSLVKPTDLAAIRMSDLAREQTGFPVAHRSHPDAFDPLSSLGKHVENDLPLFQVVHDHLVDIPDQPAPGSEDSIGSFILPPGWSASAPAASYPILFNGFYDLNGSTLNGLGPQFIRTLGALYRNPAGPRRAVGVLWNGGGASACFTFQPSVYDGGAKLIADAASLLRGDPERMVFTGGSRGAITALELASNPFGKPYTAKFCIAAAPQYKPGTAFLAANPTYSLGMGSIPIVTGYADAWISTWTEPGTGFTGRQLTAFNAFGTTNFSSIDTNWGVDSDLFLNALAAEGTRVVLRVGTNDFSVAYAQGAEYTDHMRSKGIPSRLEVHYRFGHSMPPVVDPDETNLLNRVFDNNYVFPSTTEHYARNPADYTLSVHLTPPLPHIPLVYECPITVGTGQFQTWRFVGQPGGRYQVRAAKMMPGWKPGDLPALSGPLTPVMSGLLSSNPGDEFGTATVSLSWSVALGYWWYEVRYSPDGDTTYEVTLGQHDIAAPTLFPNQEPVVFVTASEVQGVDDKARTGGVAEDGRLLP